MQKDGKNIHTHGHGGRLYQMFVYIYIPYKCKVRRGKYSYDGKTGIASGSHFYGVQQTDYMVFFLIGDQIWCNTICNGMDD